MTNITYVSLSDMHLGACNSILTNLGPGDDGVDPSQPSEVLIKLANCLRKLIEENDDGVRPTLVLNGDILELALASDNVAAMAFQRFIELVMPEDAGKRLFADEILVIPGNHDHHLWETARETQYANFLGHLRLGTFLPKPWHTTKMIDDKGVPSRFIDVLLHKCSGLRGVSAKIMYPNYAILGDRGRFVIFSHGHYTESIYMLMTTLNDMLFPGRERRNTTYEIEAENFAWVDFFWSTMGRSGGTVGGNVERIYESMQDPSAFARLLSRFLGALIAKRVKWTWLAWFWGALLLLFLRKLVLGRLERAAPERVLSDQGEGLRNFLMAVREQIKCELGKHRPPENVTFIFGHTHKPFEQMMQVDGFPDDRVAVYNSGGWVVDRPNAQSLYGGAIVLVDENLDVASLRMYNEAENADQYAVKVHSAWPPPAVPTPLFQRVDDLIRVDDGPWRSFSAAAAAAVDRYTRKLARTIGQVV
jgi:hypothetical protein